MVRLEGLGNGPPDPMSLAARREPAQRTVGQCHMSGPAFILDALCPTIMPEGDVTWELELEVPRGPSANTSEELIVNEKPRLGLG